MVLRFWNMIHKEISGLHEAAFLLGIFALLSQVLALVRDRLLAHTFGASAALDIYYAAFRIPDFLTVSLGSFVASTVLIPFLVERLDDRARARAFFDSVFTAFWWLMIGVSAVTFVLMPWLTYIAAPGFPAASHDSLVLLSRILLLSPLLLGISSLFASVTQSFNKFFVYAMCPVVYNAGIIIGIVVFYPIFGLAGLAWGVAFGALLHMGIQLPVLLRAGFVPRLNRPINMRDVREVTTLSLPRTLALSAQNIAVGACIALASLMGSGSIAIFQFAYNLQSVPLSIIGVSYSVAAFPTLAKFFARGEHGKFVGQVVGAARHVLFWSLPILTLFVIERVQIVRVILGSGRFSYDDTLITAAGLALFSVSIAAQSLILIFVRGYYAAGQTKKPVVINMLMSLGIIIVAIGSLLFIKFRPGFLALFASLMGVPDIANTQVLILPAIFSIGMLANASVLWYTFRTDFSGHYEWALGRAFRDSLIGSVALGAIAYLMLGLAGRVFDIHTFVGIFLQGLSAGIAGIIAGTLVLVSLGNAEVHEVARLITRRFWKSAAVAIAPDTETL